MPIRLPIRSGLAFLLLGLAACETPDPDQPFGAPVPRHGDMIFVDGEGCRWWVIGSASNRSWARQTDRDGKVICDETTQPAPKPAANATEAEVAAPVAAMEPDPAPVEADPAVSYLVQVATFRERANATAAERNFRTRGLPVTPVSEDPGEDELYQLLIGPFADRAAAEAAIVIVKTEGFDDAFIRTRR